MEFPELDLSSFIFTLASRVNAGAARYAIPDARPTDILWRCRSARIRSTFSTELAYSPITLFISPAMPRFIFTQSQSRA